MDPGIPFGPTDSTDFSDPHWDITVPISLLMATSLYRLVSDHRIRDLFGKNAAGYTAAFDPPAHPVVVEDEVTLARVRKGIDLVQQELDLLRKLVERPTPLERMG
jgi:hypothetical protein